MRRPSGCAATLQTIQALVPNLGIECMPLKRESCETSCDSWSACALVPVGSKKPNHSFSDSSQTGWPLPGGLHIGNVELPCRCCAWTGGLLDRCKHPSQLT